MVGAKAGRSGLGSGVSGAGGGLGNRPSHSNKFSRSREERESRRSWRTLVDARPGAAFHVCDFATAWTIAIASICWYIEMQKPFALFERRLRIGAAFFIPGMIGCAAEGCTPLSSSRMLNGSSSDASIRLSLPIEQSCVVLCLPKSSCWVCHRCWCERPMSRRRLRHHRQRHPLPPSWTIRASYPDFSFRLASRPPESRVLMHCSRCCITRA